VYSAKAHLVASTGSCLQIPPERSLVTSQGLGQEPVVQTLATGTLQADFQAQDANAPTAFDVEQQQEGP
jgi:hypothetical protein